MQENQSDFLQSILSPTVGYLSPTMGAIEIHILRDAELLCTSRSPSSGLADDRFTVSGDNNYPSVRVWPGCFNARIVVFVGASVSMSFAVRGKVRLGLSTAFVLLSSGREAERITVQGEKNLSLAVDSVRLWSGFQARRVVVDEEK